MEVMIQNPTIFKSFSEVENTPLFVHLFIETFVTNRQIYNVKTKKIGAQALKQFVIIIISKICSF